VLPFFGGNSVLAVIMAITTKLKSVSLTNYDSQARHHACIRLIIVHVLLGRVINAYETTATKSQSFSKVNLSNIVSGHFIYLQVD
jgi:hypothetical protein